jgi:hypothetical protein
MHSEQPIAKIIGKTTQAIFAQALSKDISRGSSQALCHMETVRGIHASISVPLIAIDDIFDLWLNSKEV